MEIEVLFMFQWSISQFSDINDFVTVDSHNDIDTALKELLTSEESVNTSRFNVTKDRFEVRIDSIVFKFYNLLLFR